MSDNDDDYMCEEEEDYGLEYSEDSNSEPDVDLENQYYNSKSLKEDHPESALQSFQKVLELEEGEKGEWGFKALKQMIKINFKLLYFKYGNILSGRNFSVVVRNPSVRKSYLHLAGFLSHSLDLPLCKLYVQ